VRSFKFDAGQKEETSENNMSMVLWTLNSEKSKNFNDAEDKKPPTTYLIFDAGQCVGSGDYKVDFHENVNL
jgi:hypothetical protein